ncbi:hypothetical protein JB92DRAFT_3115658 [Gautieria morchelliformis]|nr:hypothetical protein JB92DRAFT_3115658 [Gautieria morchelliformis]
MSHATVPSSHEEPSIPPMSGCIKNSQRMADRMVHSHNWASSQAIELRRELTRAYGSQAVDKGGALDSQTTDSQFVWGALGVPGPDSSAIGDVLTGPPVKMEATPPQLLHALVTHPQITPSRHHKRSMSDSPYMSDSYNVYDNASMDSSPQVQSPNSAVHILDRESQVHEANTCNHMLCSVIDELELTVARLQGGPNFAIHEARWRL